MEFKAGDYIAYTDKQITIVWRRNFEIFVYSSSTGELLDTLYESTIEDIDTVDYYTQEYVDMFYSTYPQEELAL